MKDQGAPHLFRSLEYISKFLNPEIMNPFLHIFVILYNQNPGSFDFKKGTKPLVIWDSAWLKPLQAVISY